MEENDAEHSAARQGLMTEVTASAEEKSLLLEFPTLEAIVKESVTSSYVNDAYYERMRHDLMEFDAFGRVPTQAEREKYEAIVLHESWLLDRRRFEQWYGLYSRECMYWVPAAGDVYESDTADPQRNVTIACDDRRRMGDRIVWLRTGVAYSQLPPSFTTHSHTGFVVVPSSDPAEFKLRSQFVIHERRAGHELQTMVGWMGHTFVEEDGVTKIARKTVCLLDGHRAHHNLVFLL